MTDPMPTRVSEAQADRAITRLLLSDPIAERRLLAAIGPEVGAAAVTKIDRQSRHAIDTGSIDQVIHLSTGWQLLVENKIDADWSVTRSGQAQPLRYGRTISAL